MWMGQERNVDGPRGITTLSLGNSLSIVASIYLKEIGLEVVNQRSAKLLTFGGALVDLCRIFRGSSSIPDQFAWFCLHLSLSCKTELCSGRAAKL